MSKPTIVNGWRLLFHPLFIGQMITLDAAAQKALPENPGNANVKLFNQVSKLIMERIPADPAGPEFRQGKTMGPLYKHWRRAKFGGNRFRLYFRYSEKDKLIAIVWMNDEKGMRKRGDRNDPYVVFRKMLESGEPPDSLDDLFKACKDGWKPPE